MKRYQIDFSDEVYEDLTKLKPSRGTMANVIRNALKLYKLLKEEEDEGGKLIIESKKGGRKQIIVP